MSDNHNHAIDNAKAWLAEITRWATADYSDDSEERDASRPEPLSIEVRSSWTAIDSASEMNARNGEYSILLSTGGPALRLIGELSDYCEPDNVRVEWQDWGTPWTRLECSPGDATDKQLRHALTYAQSFYFGE